VLLAERLGERVLLALNVAPPVELLLTVEQTV